MSACLCGVCVFVCECNSQLTTRSLARVLSTGAAVTATFATTAGDDVADFEIDLPERVSRFRKRAQSKTQKYAATVAAISAKTNCNWCLIYPSPSFQCAAAMST